jgi:hypothetical protein
MTLFDGIVADATPATAITADSAIIAARRPRSTRPATMASARPLHPAFFLDSFT